MFDERASERGLLLSFYAAKIEAARRDASGRLLGALIEALRAERRAALDALDRKWAIRREAARADRRCRSLPVKARPLRPSHFHEKTRPNENNC